VFPGQSLILLLVIGIPCAQTERWKPRFAPITPYTWLWESAMRPSDGPAGVDHFGLPPFERFHWRQVERTRLARSTRAVFSLARAPRHRLTLQQRRAYGSFAGGACCYFSHFLEEIYAAIQYCSSEYICVFDRCFPCECPVAGWRGNCRGLCDGRFRAVIVKASVELRNSITGYRIRQQPDTAGAFRITGVPSNPYRLTVSAPGFSPVDREIRCETAVRSA